MKTNLETLYALRQYGRFKLGKYQIIKLDDKNNGTLCMFCDPIFKSSFDDFGSNNWVNATLRKKLSERSVDIFPKQIDLLPFERDLSMDNGRGAYGQCVDTFSILTVKEYRKFKQHLPIGKNMFWTITAVNDLFPNIVRCIDKTGRIAFGYPKNDYIDVYPIFMLKPITLVESYEY